MNAKLTGRGSHLVHSVPAYGGSEPMVFAHVYSSQGRAICGRRPSSTTAWERVDWDIEVTCPRCVDRTRRRIGLNPDWQPKPDLGPPPKYSQEWLRQQRALNPTIESKRKFK